MCNNTEEVGTFVGSMKSVVPFVLFLIIIFLL